MKKLILLAALFLGSLSFLSPLSLAFDNDISSVPNADIVSVIVPYLLFDDAGSENDIDDDDRIVLPIEVLGQIGVESDLVRFNLNATQLASAEKLWFMVNNLSYEDKGSIRINGGNWIPLNHETVDLYDAEMARGGMAHGGYNTVRFTMPADRLNIGSNRLRFRYTKPDGISIGYRVIRFNVLDQRGEKLLANSLFREDNPRHWVGPYTDDDSVEQGRRLWEGIDANGNDLGLQLWNHHLPNSRAGFWYDQSLPKRTKIQAKCASCHTHDGRDLEYFSYSNLSIIERSKFHGLSELEGEKIASYIRSLALNGDDDDRLGRPWNPPYQPGKDLENKPIEQWAAGAGIDAVLEKDEDMLPHLFPNGATKESIRSLFDSDKMMDRTIIPLAIQFPDWKHWLPMIHPLDAFNVDVTAVSNNDPLQTIKNVRAYFEQNRQRFEANGHTRNDQFTRQLTNLQASFRTFFEKGRVSGSHWRSQGGDAERNLIDDVSIEYVKTSFARLLAVKSFEFTNEFNLQDKAHLITSSIDQPAQRQWATQRYSVFEVPAHFTANNTRNFESQKRETGLYESTNWYQLQMLLNGGNGIVAGTQPTDYNYHNQHIGLASEEGNINDSLRYFVSLSQIYQIRSWSGNRSEGPYGPDTNFGFRMRQQGPFHFVGMAENGRLLWGNNNTPEVLFGQLDQAQPGLSTLILEALILQFMQEMNRPENAIVTWRRSENSNSKDWLDPITKTTSELLPFDEIFRSPKQGLNADRMYGAIAIFKEQGVECSVLNQLVDWSKRAWPEIDFQNYRQNDC